MPTIKDLTILIADDNDDLRRLFFTASKSMGLKVLQAADGQEAYDIFIEKEPEIVVTDFDMPELNGIELIRKISMKSAETKTLLLTGVGNEQVAIDALECGAGHYLKKPVDLASFKRIVKEEVEDILKSRQVVDISQCLKKRNIKLKFKTDIFKVPDIIAILVEKTEAYLPSYEMLKVELGLSELITNAVEHGNLGITYNEKSEALKENRLEQLYEEKLHSDGRQDKTVFVNFVMNDEYCEWRIVDQGDGFDWQKQPSPCMTDKLLCLHGRGIFISKIQFDSIEYEGKGNIVTARKYRKQND